jgi:hypothetical protein
VHTEYLRQHEGVATIVAEPIENVVQGNAVRSIGRRERADPAPCNRIVEHGSVTSTASLGTTGVVNADPAGNREEPPLGRPVSSVPVERPHGPLVDLLRQVVSVTRIAEVSAQLPNVGLGFGHESFERATVAISRIEQQSRQMVHPMNIVAAGNRFPGTYDLLFRGT